jgi:lambda repressor-like predicted transcriptional regulator
MIIHRTEDLHDFTRAKWEKSGLTIREISKQIGIDERQLAKAVQKSRRSDTSVNGYRRSMLKYLGFRMDKIYSVVRQKKVDNTG